MLSDRKERSSSDAESICPDREIAASESKGGNMELLVKKAQRGDAEAFIVLIEKNKESLKRIAFSYLKNEEDIADAIQETILNAYENIKTLKKAAYFRTWLVRILINNCTKIYRRNKEHIHYEYTPEEVLPDKNKEKFSVFFSTELEFRNLLEQLPEESRTIFQLYFGEQFTTAEIAEILKMNENTVKSRIHRGKEVLRKELKN